MGGGGSERQETGKECDMVDGKKESVEAMEAMELEYIRMYSMAFELRS